MGAPVTSAPGSSSRHTTRRTARRTTRRIIDRARAWGPLGILLLARTFGLLLVARLALRWLPVAKVIAWKQRPIVHPTPLTPEDTLERRLLIRRAVLLVARHSPIRFVCFPQCLAASALLRSRGIPSRLHYGVARDQTNAHGKLITHTWLEAAGEILIGGEVAADYSTLAVY